MKVSRLTSIVAMLYPERFAEPATSAAYERERCDHNITALRWSLPGLAMLHAFAGLTFTRLPAATDAQAAWIYWVIRMHAAMTCFDAVTAIACRWPCFIASCRRSGRATASSTCW